MFLKQTPRADGRIYFSIVKSYRDENGKPKQKTIQKIGYLNDLLNDYDDPEAYFKRKAQEMTEAEQLETALSVTIDMTSPLDYGCNLYNVGYFAFKYIYNELGLTDFLTKKQFKLNIEYSLNKCLQLLVFSRILYPGSKKAAFERKDRFFEPFEKVTKDSVYDSLDYFNDYKLEIQKLMWEKSKEFYHRDASNTFYDCTNYYFEIEYNDEDIVLDDGEGNTITVQKGLRKRGPEKNKRPDPIVEMGLLMDANGIPMAYHLFPGNESEKLSLRPIIKQVKSQFGIQRTIVVADRGLNTSDNIYYLAGKNDEENSNMDGYVYGQSVRGADKEFKEWVLDEKDYQIDTIHEGGEEIKFKHKSRVYAKEIKIKKDGKRKVKVNVCQKQMAYFSQKYCEKQRKDREKMVNKAKDLIKNPGSYTRATSYGAAGYVTNLEFDKETGEIKETEKHLVIDVDKINEEAKYDGYYSIVTSEIELSDIEIRNIYRGLAKIEDTFKVSKSSLGSRPVHVWTREHIEGHFLTCFVALVIMRLLETRLGNKYSIDRIIESTRNYNCVNIDKNIYQFLFKDEIIDDISKEFDVNLDIKYRTRENIKKLLKY